MKTTLTNDYRKKAFEKGDATEEHFAKRISGKGYESVKITSGKFPEYDISAEKNGYHPKWEIKTSSEVSLFGAHFIEYWQSDEPSGMQLTTADYQVYYGDDGYIYCISTQELDQYISNHDLKLTDTKYITESGKVSAKGYVVSSNVFSVLGTHDINIS